MQDFYFAISCYLLNQIMSRPCYLNQISNDKFDGIFLINFLRDKYDTIICTCLITDCDYSTGVVSRIKG